MSLVTLPSAMTLYKRGRKMNAVELTEAKGLLKTAELTLNRLKSLKKPTDEIKKNLDELGLFIRVVGGKSAKEETPKGKK